MDLPERVRVVRDGDVARVVVEGNITDTSDLSDIAAIKAPHVVIDLENFGRMTSRGVLIWMHAMEELCRHVPEVQIQNVPHTFLQTYAMIHGLTASARIDSIRAVYACERCGNQKTTSFFRSHDFPDGHLTPRAPPSCDRCKQEMIGDDLIFELNVNL